MTDVVQTAIDKAQARVRIDRWVNEYIDGVSDRKLEAIGLAKQAELDAGVVEARFDDAEKLRAASIARTQAAKPEPQVAAPSGAVVAVGGIKRRLTNEPNSATPNLQTMVAAAAAAAEKAEKQKDAAKALAAEVAERIINRKALPAEPKSEPDTAAEFEAEAEPEPVAAELSLPGVAGEIQQHYLRTAMQPSEIMSLAIGLMVPTTLIFGNVIGPSGPKGCALQQTIAVLVPTSGGKQYAIDFTKECVTKAGLQRLLGPNRFKSGPALVRHMKENRVQLCIQDEFGRLLAKLGNPRSAPSELEINERMREFWALGPGSIYNSPVGAAQGDDSEMIINARLSIFGFGNRDEFFAACRGDDVINGFLNRIVVLEEPRMIRPRNIGPIPFPKALQDNLCKLAAIKSRQLGWTAAARDIYEAELDRAFGQTDDRKRKLWARTPEKIVRAATAFATSRFATEVDRTDMEVAQAIMRISDGRIKDGMDKAEAERQLDHAELKIEIARRLLASLQSRNQSIIQTQHQTQESNRRRNRRHGQQRHPHRPRGSQNRRPQQVGSSAKRGLRLIGART
jgi:hypothetical protein